VVVAGSTCDGKPAPEEQIFLQGAMGPVWQSFPATLLVLAPRQTDRFAEVFSLASEFGPTVRATHLLSHNTESISDKKIIVLDTIGDLAAIYGIADVAFVGGSLVARGGHNPLEPAQFGVPVVMGPSYENFRDIVGKMQAVNGIAIVEDEFGCHEVLLNLLGRTPADRIIGSNGQQVFLSEAGATERVVAELMELVR
jgi:3-deoxy-D-manno-octulosonic-acid transferase